MSFRRRLALFLVVTLVAIQGLTAFFAYTYLRHDLLERGKQDLATATGVFTRQLDFLSERVADGVQVLSLDFALRSAIAQHDYGTEISALRNHGNRIGATRMMIVGLDGQTAADTGAAGGARTFPYPGLLQEAAASDKGTALASLGGQIYWIVVVPVRAPVPIAFIAACIPVDDVLLEKLRTISSQPRAIVLSTPGPSGHWMIAAESTGHPRQVDLPAAGMLAASSSVVTEDGKEYLAVSAPLKTVAGSAPVVAMLDYPLDEALSAYRGVIMPMIGVLMLGLLAMLAGAALIVRGVSRPLEMLGLAARRIATGDYTPPPRIARKDEVGQLGDALIAMTASIAEREHALRDAIVETEAAKDQAVRANSAKSQFLSNMSHELRTPLNAILGFSELIEAQALGPIGVPRYANYAGDIHGAGRHLLGLVERMLDLAEAEANRLVIERVVLSPGEQVTAAVAGLSDFIAKSGVHLTCDDAQTWPPIRGDAGKLRDAFRNIIHNAVRFTPAGGTVTIGGRTDAAGLTITFTDSGIGMAPDLLETVTRPFHRLRSAFDGKQQGAGLGLPFAKAVVELHGGTLTLESRVGGGTTVSLFFPSDTALSRAA